MNLTEADFARLRARLARLPEKDRLDAPAIARRLARLDLPCDDDTVRLVMSYERGELVPFADSTDSTTDGETAPDSASGDAGSGEPADPPEAPAAKPPAKRKGRS